MTLLSRADARLSHKGRITSTVVCSHAETWMFAAAEQAYAVSKKKHGAIRPRYLYP